MFVKLFILLTGFAMIKAENGVWEKFKIDFNKTYSKSFESRARKIFEENLVVIKNHNLMYEKGLTSFRMGVNEFSDEDFYGSLLQNGFKVKPGVNELNDGSLINEKLLEFSNFKMNQEVPRSFDWRNYIQMTEVKNQKECRSCYAFAVVGAVESLIYRQTGEIVDLSEQELVDCGRGFAMDGCNNGYSFGAVAYIIKNGLSYEKDYPYTGKRSSCKRNETTLRYHANFTKILAPFYNIESSSENSLMRQLYLHGPLPLTFYMTDNFIRYLDGIYYEEECGKNTAGHVMLLVGYGSEKRKDYWLLKNSWGEKWGSDGFVKIARNKNNHCAIATWVISIA